MAKRKLRGYLGLLIALAEIAVKEGQKANEGLVVLAVESEMEKA
jgi:hypothetical protein